MSKTTRMEPRFNKLLIGKGQLPMAGWNLFRDFRRELLQLFCSAPGSAPGFSVPGYPECGFIFTHPAQLNASTAPAKRARRIITYGFLTGSPPIMSIYW